MDVISREIVAYGLIGGVFSIGLLWFAVTNPRRKREKMRRKGNKRYGH